VIGERGAGRLGFELPYLRDYVGRMRDERGGGRRSGCLKKKKTPPKWRFR